MKSHAPDGLIASPTERAPPIWRKPNQPFKPQKLQVITRGHPLSTNINLKQTLPHSKPRKHLNNNRKPTRATQNRVHSGGFNVNVFDSRHTQNSYSITDGGLHNSAVGKFPPLPGFSNKRKEMFHQSSAAASDVSTSDHSTKAFRRRHLGNGRLRSSSLTSSSTTQQHEFNEQQRGQIALRAAKINNNSNKRRLRLG